MTKRKDPKDFKPTGRPSKYEDRFATDEFLDEFIALSLKRKELPSKVGLAVYLKVAEETLDNWAVDKPEFFRCLKRLLSIEKQTLVNKGLTKAYDSNLAKFLLSGCHGISEKHTLAGDKENPVAVCTMVVPSEMIEKHGSKKFRLSFD